MTPSARRLLRRTLAAALAPAILAGSLLDAAAAAAQVVSAAVPAAGASGVSAAAAAGVRTLASPALGALSAPSALSAAPSVPALGFSGPAAAVAAPLAAAPAAAPALPAAAAASAPAAGPSDPAKPAAPAPTRLPRTRAEAARAFRAVASGVSGARTPHSPAPEGAALFDGSSARPTFTPAQADALAERMGGVRQNSPAAGLRKAPAKKAPPQTEDAPQGIPLAGADPKDAASVEKALRALVDSEPQAFGAPSGQLGKVSVSILPAVQEGQGQSILAVFKQVVTGQDRDGSPYQLAVTGRSLAFHIKVFADGTPVIMSASGSLAPGVDPAVMTVNYDDAALAGLAAKAAQHPMSAKGMQAKAAPAAKASPKKSPKTRTKKPAPRSKPGRGKSRPRNGSDEEAAAGAEDEPAPSAPRFLTRELTDELGGKWRAVDIYQAAAPTGKPVIAIVDVKSGEAWAFDPTSFRAGALAPAAAPQPVSDRMNLISGKVVGRATLPTADGGDHGEIGPIALPFTNVYDESGKVVAVTDAQGNFSIPDDGSNAPKKLTVRLAGPLVPFVKDENAKDHGPVEVTVQATPGEAMTITLNPVSADPELAANIVGYVGYLNHHIWVKGLPGMDAARMDIPLAGGMVVNGHEAQGNAFYNPAEDSVNLMAAAVIKVKDSKGRPVTLKVENTAVWSIEDHEDTHRVVQIYSQLQLTPEQQASPVYRFVKWSMDAIMGADVNESIADVVSYFMRKASTVGEGFYEGSLPNGKPDLIRSAEEKTVYDPKAPDPHNGVLAQAMWAVRSAFISALGESAGSAYANAMIPLILIAQPLNPIDALLHMIVWDMRADGSSPFGDLIRRIAKDDHGIDLPPTPRRPTPQA
ncbi:MAG: hypothetical protein HY079_04750 [Elusimicrobia bacterium]|nr:hypothetical protein [Elusimicrobiota bacterium]